MDTSIKLRNADTEQEVAFENQEAAEHFKANVEDGASWAAPDAAKTDDTAPKKHKK